MKILAVDTASPYCSAALCDDGIPIASKTLDKGLTHSETLLPLIDSLLTESGLTVGDIDLFCVSSCPGSFTGVRIGVCAVKGFAFGSGKPCVGVSTIEALARNLSAYDGIICPVMDARRNQFYNAVFSCSNGKLTRLCDDRMIGFAELQNELSSYDAPVYLCGDGAELARSLFKKIDILPVPSELIPENAVSVAKAGLEKYKNGTGSFSDSALFPGYLRPSQAEREKNHID